MTVASSSPATTIETKPSTGVGKRSTKKTNNVHNQSVETDHQQQHIQLVTMDQNTIMGDCNNQYIIQLPQNQAGGQFQVLPRI